MAESVFKECRKRKATYRIIAFDALGTICETYEIDIFKDVHAMLTPIVNPVSYAVLHIANHVFSYI